MPTTSARTKPKPTWDAAAMIDQILAAWRVNNEITLKLLKAIPEKGFAAVPSQSRGRTVAEQFIHVHNSRVKWMMFNGERDLEGAVVLDRHKHPTRVQIIEQFRCSGAAAERYLRERLTTSTKIKFCKGSPVRWMCYQIAHDSHHRGQILLALKQNGMRMKEDVALQAVWGSWMYGEF